MNKKLSERSAKVQANKAINGVIYGLFSGLAFSLATWGYDGYLLANSSAGLPWLKLAMGGVLCLAIGGVVGWLTAKKDSTVVGVIGWLAAGIAFVWIASRLPFQGVSSAYRIIDPHLGSLIDYPYSENIQARALILYVAVGIVSAVVGLLETNMVESASWAYSQFLRLLPLAACVPLFVLGGITSDNMINEPLRKPIVSIHQLIQYGIETQGQQVDPVESARRHLRALSPVQDLIKQPYRIYMGSYEATYMESFVVLINFDGNWAQCTVMITSPAYCKPLTSPTTQELPGIANQNPNSSSGNETPSAKPAVTAIATPQVQVSTPIQLQTTALLPGAQASLAPLSNAPRYTITLNVDFAAQSFNGRARLDYTNAEETSLDKLYFRLMPNGKASYGNGSLSVTQVLLDGQPAQTQLSLNDTILEVKLPGPLEPGQGAQLEFTFSGIVPKDFGGNATPSGYGIYNFSDDVMALSAWYPTLAVYDQQGWNLDPASDIGDSVYSDTAFYTVDVTAPSDLVVAATGIDTQRQSSGGQAHYHFISGPARDFFLILSPNFKVESKTVDGTTVNSYYLPGDTAGGQQALSVATDSLHIYNQHFGAYPYTELDVVEAPMRNASGVEFPGIVLIGSDLYANSYDPSFSVTTAHEVAHQWWYNVVGNDVFDEPWLDEALTSYSSSLYLEFTQGQSAYNGLISYWQNHYDQAVAQGKDDAITATLAHFESLNDPFVYSRIVYDKGALFFKAVRDEIGDRAFFQALQNYYQNHQYQIATANDLLGAFEEAAGRPLDDFYKKWLYAPPS